MSDTEYATDGEVSDTKAEFTESALTALVSALEPADSDGVMSWEGIPPEIQNEVRVVMVGILSDWEDLLRADFRASQPEAERVLGFQPQR